MQIFAIKVGGARKYNLKQLYIEEGDIGLFITNLPKVL